MATCFITKLFRRKLYSRSMVGVRITPTMPQTLCTSVFELPRGRRIEVSNIQIILEINKIITYESFQNGE